MAPSKPATAENVVNERRLRPIYDWLDNFNNKKALQEADKVLKKQPSLHCAKVLKALAMIRLGKSEEAQLLLTDVLTLEPCDDATLQAMTICFKETHRPELTCKAYEAAVKKDPNNEEFLSHLFMGYVRLGDYRKQQQTAMALFKAKPKNPYYFWAVMSIVMQAYGNDDEKVCLSVTLPLAERMIKKFVDDNKIEAEAEVQLYLMILEKEGKFRDALQVINGPLAGKLASGVAQTKRGDYLRQLQMWPQVLDHFECLLRQQPDQWTFYVNYFEALFHLCDSGDGDMKATVDRAVSLLDCLQSELSGAKERIRGPYLARLYLWQQLHERQVDAAALLQSEGRALLESYVSLLGDKPCAFQDLRLFARSLLKDGDEQEVDLFLKFCSAEAGGDGDVSAVSTVKQLCRHLLHAQLTFFLGGHTSDGGGDKVQKAAQFWSQYLATKSLNSGLLATDFRPNDNYALMAAHLLLDAWKESGAEAGSALLAKCLLLLETALLESPANYHLKLLAMRVYTVAGHGRAALQRYETLDVKYIQLDSLGHLLCRPLIALGLPSAASPLLSATLRFFTSHARETSESLIAAYKFGSFLQIPEFTKLSEKLDQSMHFAAATAERMLLDLLLADACSPPHSGSGSSAAAGRARLINTAAGMYADPDKDQPSNWSSLVDNRDCSILISWHPPQKLPCDEQVIKKKTFEAEVQFAQLRNRLVHALIAAISLSPGWQQATVEEGNGIPPPPSTATSVGGKNGSVVDQLQQTHEANGSGGSHQSARHLVLQRLIDELRRLLLQLQPESFICHSQFCIQSPPPPRLYTYVADKCLEPLLILFDCCVSVFVSSSSSSSSTEAASNGVLVETYEKALSQVIESAQQEPTANLGFWRHYVRLERVYNATETICMCVMTLSTMYSCVKANISSGGGAKKKKKQQQQQSAESSKDAVELVNGLVQRTASSWRRLETLLDEMQLMEICCPDRLVISDGEGADEESERIAQEVRKKTATSSATAEMKNLLADKRKVLDSLTFV